LQSWYRRHGCSGTGADGGSIESERRVTNLDRFWACESTVSDKYVDSEIGKTLGGVDPAKLSPQSPHALHNLAEVVARFRVG
jgi:hypothetical protein